MPKKLTTEEFIRRAIEVHGDRYDYSKVHYINSITKVCIICPIHGEFWQRPSSHLQGVGCCKCFGNTPYNTDRFIKESIQRHGDFYNYTHSVYMGMNNNIEIICPIHGSFWQKAGVHIRGSGCVKCVGLAKLTTDVFIHRSRLIHGEKFDYSKVEYKNNHTKVCIICPEHGEFWQTPAEHLSGRGCRKCADIMNGVRRRLSVEEFISKSKAIHGDRYNYSNVDYKGGKVKICIICHEHGEFWQTPENHLRGQGCPVCNTKSKGENAISVWLQNHNIDYKREYHVNLQVVLFGRNKIRVDFYLPSLNAIIEFHGRQHYIRQNIWQTEEQFAEQQDRDRRLREYCKRHKIRLIEIPYTEIGNIGKILSKTLTTS